MKDKIKKLFSNFSLVKFCIRTALIILMLKGANLALSAGYTWTSIGGIFMFMVALIVWTVLNTTQQLYKEGFADGAESERIYKGIFEKLNEGKDEVEMEFSNEFISSLIDSFEHNIEFISDKGPYMIIEMENVGETTKVKFKKIQYV